MLENYTPQLDEFKKLFTNDISIPKGMQFDSFIKTIKRLKDLWFFEKTWDDIFKEFKLEEIYTETIKHAKNYYKFENHDVAKNLLAKRKFKCFAPFTTINFDQNGNMNVCCYNRSYVLGTYPKDSVHDAWFGKNMEILRNDIQKLYFDRGCDLCVEQIADGNYENSLIYKFNTFFDDKNHNPGMYPANFEFEISNICNYECIMCGGKWSSSIRKNREKLPLIPSPYDDKFLEQLDEFLPYLKMVRFLGGEPFATPIYYKILDKLAEVNKLVYITLTTNGSICNDKVLNLKKTFPNISIVLSLDSINPDTYAMIRKNGSLETVLKNVEMFTKFNMLASVVFCPLIQNVKELSNIIEFAVTRGLSFGINTVTTALGGKIKGIHENGTETIVGEGTEFSGPAPTLDTKIPEFVLATLDKEKLSEIASYLEKERIRLCNKIPQMKHFLFINQFDGFLRYIYNLIDQKN